MSFQGIVKHGYRVDESGGTSIIVFEQPSMRSGQKYTLPLRSIITLVDTLLMPDNRLWFKYADDIALREGWVVGYGNTGIKYIEPLDSGLGTQLYEEFMTFIQSKYTNTGNPILMNNQNPSDSHSSTHYNSLPSSLNNVAPPPTTPVDPITVYTEGKSPLTDGVTIEGGVTKTFHLYSNFINSDTLTKSIDTVKKNLNIFPNGDMGTIKNSLLTKFNRFKIDYPDYHLTKSFSHIFFTRPDLNIYKEKKTSTDALQLVDVLSNDGLYYYLDQSDRLLLSSLTKQFSSNHDLNPYLSNLASSFEVSDEFIKTSEHGETLTGYKIQYGKHNIESRTAGSFSINYTDDKNLSIYKLHKAWVEYISRVFRGALAPKQSYIQKKILDYPCSVYYIVCGADGETILFWSKYYGLFPTNAPSSFASWSKGSMIKTPEYSVSYSYATKEDYNPAILVELNENSRGNFVYKKNFIPELGHSGTSLSGNPYIETVFNDRTGEYELKLRFRE